MIKSALSLVSAILAVEMKVASADPYPDSFADYLNARGLYFDYLSAAEESWWVRTSSGDIVLALPSAVAPTISVVTAEVKPSDPEVVALRNDVELALSSALDRLGVHRCSDVADDRASCIPFRLQIGFGVRHDDVVRGPDLRAASGRQLAAVAREAFNSRERVYAMGCGTDAQTSSGAVTHLDAAFSFEAIPSDIPASQVPTSYKIDLGASKVVVLREMKPLTSGMEKCILGLLGVPLVPDLPSEDVGYYVARSLETLHEA